MPERTWESLREQISEIGQTDNTYSLDYNHSHVTNLTPHPLNASNPYECAKRIFEWMRSNFSYEMTVLECKPTELWIVPYSISILKGVCSHQSLVFCAIARKCGLPCVYYVGMLVGGAHGWVNVYVGDAWIHVDVVNNQFGIMDWAANKSHYKTWREQYPNCIATMIDGWYLPHHDNLQPRCEKLMASRYIIHPLDLTEDVKDNTIEDVSISKKTFTPGETVLFHISGYNNDCQEVQLHVRGMSDRLGRLQLAGHKFYSSTFEYEFTEIGDYNYYFIVVRNNQAVLITEADSFTISGEAPPPPAPPPPTPPPTPGENAITLFEVTPTTVAPGGQVSIHVKGFNKDCEFIKYTIGGAETFEDTHAVDLNSEFDFTFTANVNTPGEYYANGHFLRGTRTFTMTDDVLFYVSGEVPPTPPVGDDVITEVIFDKEIANVGDQQVITVKGRAKEANYIRLRVETNATFTWDRNISGDFEVTFSRETTKAGRHWFKFSLLKVVINKKNILSDTEKYYYGVAVKPDEVTCYVDKAVYDWQPKTNSADTYFYIKDNVKGLTVSIKNDKIRELYGFPESGIYKRFFWTDTETGEHHTIDGIIVGSAFDHGTDCHIVRDKQGEEWLIDPAYLDKIELIDIPKLNVGDEITLDVSNVNNMGKKYLLTGFDGKKWTYHGVDDIDDKIYLKGSKNVDVPNFIGFTPGEFIYVLIL